VIDIENFQNEEEEGGYSVRAEIPEIKINWNKVKETYEEVYKKVNIIMKFKQLFSLENINFSYVLYDATTASIK
jgi:hypothetical protein